MPLLRIESRPKPPPSAPRAARPATPAASGGALPVLAAGLFAGLLLVIGAAAFLLARREPGAGLPPAAPGVTGPISTTLATALPTALHPPLQPRSDLPPLNADYPRASVVAQVGGQSYSMAELEVAVRIGRVLATLTGDAPPAYDAVEMRDYQIRMLQRQVDVMLILQAAARAGLVPPDVPPDGLVSGFLEQVGATEEDLRRLMEENGVDQAQLDAWFLDTQMVNLFVQQQLMVGRDPAERNAVTREWLDRQWGTQDVVITFYEPEVASTETPGAVAP